MPKIPVTGLNKGSIDRIQKELLNKCNLIEPRYLPVVEPSTYDGKDIIPTLRSRFVVTMSKVLANCVPSVTRSFTGWPDL